MKRRAPSGRSRPPPHDLPLLVDSGLVNDELHVVQLRDCPLGYDEGLVKGELPLLFIWRNVTYRRSTFTVRAPNGSLTFRYYATRGAKRLP